MDEHGCKAAKPERGPSSLKADFNAALYNFDHTIQLSVKHTVGLATGSVTKFTI